MFNRRMLVALAACLAISATSAMAGGGGGTKKDSTIQVYNNTQTPIYVFIGQTPEEVLEAYEEGGPEGLEDIGGEMLAAGANHKYKVEAGPNDVTVAGADAQGNLGYRFWPKVNVNKGSNRVIRVNFLDFVPGEPDLE